MSTPSRRETERTSFSFPSDSTPASMAQKANLMAARATRTPEVHSGADWSGAKSADVIKQQYNAGE